MRMFLLGLVAGALLGVAGGVVVFDPETRPFAGGGSPAEPDERGEAPNDTRGEDGSRDGEPAAAAPTQGVPPTEQAPSDVAEGDLIGYLRAHLVGRPGHSIGGLGKKALAALRDRRAPHSSESRSAAGPSPPSSRR